jgi:hypothetical protein
LRGGRSREELLQKARVADVSCDAEHLHVALDDGRRISVPIRWYPRLEGATTAQRADWRLIAGGEGIHWAEIDADLSVEGLLLGLAAPGVRK